MKWLQKNGLFHTSDEGPAKNLTWGFSWLWSAVLRPPPREIHTTCLQHWLQTQCKAYFLPKHALNSIKCLIGKKKPKQKSKNIWKNIYRTISLTSFYCEDNLFELSCSRIWVPIKHYLFLTYRIPCHFLVHLMTWSILFRVTVWRAKWDRHLFLNQWGNLESSGHGPWSQV